MQIISPQLQRLSGARSAILLVVLALTGLLGLASAQVTTNKAPSQLNMYVGEVSVMALPPVKRVAVGNVSLISTSVTDTGQLILIAEGEGETAIHIWYRDNAEEDMRVFVTARDSTRTNEEIRILLSEFEGIEFWEIGNNIFLRGTLESKNRKQLDLIMEVYPTIVDLTSPPDEKTDIASLVKAFGNLTTSSAGGKTILQGQVDPAYADALKEFLKAFPNVLNLTQLQQVTQDKMVYMDVKITEFRSSDLQNLGVNWQKDINGPSAVFGTELPLRGSEIGFLNSPTEGAAAINPRLQGDLIDAVGYFGIATSITSRINLLLQDGSALLLAEPHLSTRSGGEATFLSGGEIPIIIRSTEGNTVEYKEFGIRLQIKPIVDNSGNVVANVETELSAVDNSIQSEAGPAFITRRTKTDISMRQGDTLIISGLVNQEWSDTTSGLKGLSEIPLFGALFRSKDFQARRSELVIFVTPTIVDPSSVSDADITKRRLIRGFQSTTGLKGIID